MTIKDKFLYVKIGKKNTIEISDGFAFGVFIVVFYIGVIAGALFI